MSRQDLLRSLPGVDTVLGWQDIRELLSLHPRVRIVRAVREVLDECRRAVLDAADEEAARHWVESHEIARRVAHRVGKLAVPGLRPVINATGVVIHTNLGRSLLDTESLESTGKVAGGYSNLEYDLEAGKRGSRYVHVARIIRRISGAEAAVVVNNNAAAVLLCLNSLAEGREVVVSRGELVEIGGSFRIPDVMARSGAHLVEVGTTNKTHPEDYRRAITERTALLLKVHQSNFQQVGFTAGVGLEELAALGRRMGIPVMNDLGSGSFVDLSRWGLMKEPTVQEAIGAGADVVTFSGDKLLGGPQAGIIIGKADALECIAQNPLNRALRVGKLTLAALESVLMHYEEERPETIPTIRMLIAPPSELKRRARRLQRRIREKCGHVVSSEIKPGVSRVGGGALPLQELPTWVVAVNTKGLTASALDERLRRASTPVVARIAEDRVLLDVRTVADAEIPLLVKSVTEAAMAPAEA
ncbi:MAG: L-seryl-tRNA(Sec) selenium transferase [Deltaproteobacteria bacterium]|nr:L-seryl-tRNA(Sec) selenium transferase [Deltaproteobacteria bacterium]